MSRVVAFAPAFELAKALLMMASRTRMESGPHTFAARPSHGAPPLKAKKPFFASAATLGPKYTIAP